MRTTNKKSSQFVCNFQPFKASNLSGVIEDNRLYIVYSYGWYPIYAYHFESAKWFENGEGYSLSTKRQMSQCRPTRETIVLSHASLKDLIQKR